jgi:hypothetical protein
MYHYIGRLTKGAPDTHHMCRVDGGRIKPLTFEQGCPMHNRAIRAPKMDHIPIPKDAE